MGERALQERERQERNRGQRGDPPAGQRRTRLVALGGRLCGIAPAPQQQGGDAGTLGGKLQTAPGDHRQVADLADHRSEPRFPQPLLDGPQDVVIAPRPNQHEAGGIEPVRHQARAVKVRPLEAPQDRPDHI